MSVLVAVDFSENARRALRVAARQASSRRQPLTLFHCLESGFEAFAEHQLSEPPQNLRAHLWKEAKSQLQTLYQEVVPDQERPHKVDYLVEVDHPKDGIVAAARATDAQLVVLGATGHSRLANVILGGTAEEVIRTIDTPVLVVEREAEAAPYKTIVAPVDFTECSRKSLALAAELARRESAELVILHAYVLPVADTTFMPAQMPPDMVEQFEAQRQRRLGEMAEEANLEDVTWRTRLEIGAPHRAITEVVDEKQADLVVMGTHGRRGFQRFFLGSTATKVLRRMPCSVMTVRTREDSSSEDT